MGQQRRGGGRLAGEPLQDQRLKLFNPSRPTMHLRLARDGAALVLCERKRLPDVDCEAGGGRISEEEPLRLLG
jgi:hypothetical protein